MPRFQAVSVDDVPPGAWRKTGLRWHPLRSALDVSFVGLAAFSAVRAGEPLIEPHTETEDGRGQEELYLVLRGRARFVVDGESVDAGAGTLLRVDAPAVREADALADDTVVIALGGEPEFAPSASEWLERARPLMRDDPAAARRIVDELAAAQPGSAGVRAGEALLAIGRGDRDGARVIVTGLLVDHPELRATLAADPDLRDVLPGGGP